MSLYEQYLEMEKWYKRQSIKAFFLSPFLIVQKNLKKNSKLLGISKSAKYNISDRQKGQKVKYKVRGKADSSE